MHSQLGIKLETVLEKVFNTMNGDASVVDDPGVKSSSNTPVAEGRLSASFEICAEWLSIAGRTLPIDV